MQFEPTHLYARVLEHLPPLPWQPADPNARGDPRKSVKWIDVSTACGLVGDSGLEEVNGIGPAWNRFVPGCSYPSCPCLGLRSVRPP